MTNRNLIDVFLYLNYIYNLTKRNILFLKLKL